MSVNTGAVILTGENRSTRRKTCPNATLSTINGTCSGLVSNTCMRGESQTTNQPPEARTA
jgi:hypothetical protein